MDENLTHLPSGTELRHFVEVSKTQNVSRAAERLGITQPSLSISLKRLETKMGANLLIRSKTGVKLTQSGLRLLHQTRHLLSEWENIRTTTLKAEQELSGRYSIGCHSSVALFSLRKFLPKLLSKHPKIEIKLVHNLSRKITDEIINFNIDFGIVVNPTKHPDLILRPIQTDIVCLWSTKNPSQFQKLDSSELRIICDPSLIQTQEILKKLRRHFTPKIITCSDLEVITELVSTKVGLGILPTRVATRVSSNKLVSLKKEFPTFLDHHYLAYRADVQKPKSSRLLAQFIETHLRSCDEL